MPSYEPSSVFSHLRSRSTSDHRPVDSRQPSSTADSFLAAILAHGDDHRQTKAVAEAHQHVGPIGAQVGVAHELKPAALERLMLGPQTSSNLGVEDAENPDASLAEQLLQPRRESPVDLGAAAGNPPGMWREHDARLDDGRLRRNREASWLAGAARAQLTSPTAPFAHEKFTKSSIAVYLRAISLY